MSEPRRHRVAAAHAAPILLDTEASVDKACALIDQAGEQAVDLLVFPEVFVPGFPYWINLYPPNAQFEINHRYLRASVPVPGPEIERVQAHARRNRVHVVLGVSERDGGTLYNTQVFIDDQGQLLGKHRKLQPTYAERYIWGQGDGSTLTVFQTAVGAIGGLACWEHTMNLARHALILQGEEIHCASWPSLSTLEGMAEVFDIQVDAMSRAHAISGQCFVIVAENPVTDQMIDLMTNDLGPQLYQTTGGGWSAIFHPMANALAGPHVGPEERLLIAEIDLAEIEQLKLLVDAAGHYSRPDVLRMVLDDRPHDLLVRRSREPSGTPPPPTASGRAPAIGGEPASPTHPEGLGPA